MNKKDLKTYTLPDTPGVYFFKKGTTILYIGKATSLKDRVKSYFSNDLIETRGQVLVDMVFKTDALSWRQVDSTLEALILEAELIKKYQPKYNSKEKDNRSFNYVIITKDALPKVQIIRGRVLKIEKELKLLQPRYVFGPFVSGGAIKEGLRIVRRIFPYIDRNSIQKDKYEFYKQLSLTPDTTNKEALEKYTENIKHIVQFFQGKKKDILKSLKKEMKSSVKELAFERAGVLKRQIFALEHINDTSLIKNDFFENTSNEESDFRIEAYDVAHTSGKEMVGVMTVATNASVDKNEYRKFIIKGVRESNDPKALEEMLMRRFRHSEWGIPDLVLVDGNNVQKSVAERVLKFYSLSIPVIALVKDEKHQPRDFIGGVEFVKKYKSLLLLLNNEAHRFAITFHKKKRGEAFLKK